MYFTSCLIQSWHLQLDWTVCRSRRDGIPSQAINGLKGGQSFGRSRGPQCPWIGGFGSFKSPRHFWNRLKSMQENTTKGVSGLSLAIRLMDKDIFFFLEDLLFSWTCQSYVLGPVCLYGGGLGFQMEFQLEVLGKAQFPSTPSPDPPHHVLPPQSFSPLSLPSVAIWKCRSSKEMCVCVCLKIKPDVYGKFVLHKPQSHFLSLPSPRLSDWFFPFFLEKRDL